ncbi:hypothetical protein GCM10010358_29020 [Streptomyces minutiscleroticus]|uniref:Uncharacterized protein n=1 Tax=Streptomyces minutiscleroticus TaxID=68238 RepID=A0A918NH71_9ACTN|nr:hypothetical protein GCM10010358_29020 [Streptomyces minutiscleroticus]
MAELFHWYSSGTDSGTGPCTDPGTGSRPLAPGAVRASSRTREPPCPPADIGPAPTCRFHATTVRGVG